MKYFIESEKCFYHWNFFNCLFQNWRKTAVTKCCVIIIDNKIFLERGSIKKDSPSEPNTSGAPLCTAWGLETLWIPGSLKPAVGGVAELEGRIHGCLLAMRHVVSLSGANRVNVGALASLSPGFPASWKSILPSSWQCLPFARQALVTFTGSSYSCIEKKLGELLGGTL